MSNVDLQQSHPEMYLTFVVVFMIGDITRYYKEACDELFDDSGHVNDPTPKAVQGHLLLNMVRQMVLEHPKQGKEAILSTEWDEVESARDAFRKTTRQFENKIKDMKEQDTRWNRIDENETMRPNENSDLIQICSKFWAAMEQVPVMTSINKLKYPTRSSLELELGTFQYAKLDSPKDTIRLVKMESITVSRESPIYLTTRTIRLQDDIPYATLSYTWGNPLGVFCSQEDRDAIPRTDIPIICDGMTLEIGENLYDFLCRWRQSLASFDEILRTNETPGGLENARPPSEFWIDAICINQDDIEEKNQQVSMMGDIYSKSLKTWVWLGEQDQFSREAFTVLQKVATASQEHGTYFQNLEKSDKKTMLSELDLPAAESWKWFAVFAFLHRQWFRRSWVVQEAVLSRDIVVFCGSISVYWKFLISVYLQLDHLGMRDIINSVGRHELLPERKQMVFLDYQGGTRTAIRTFEKDASALRFYSCQEGTAINVAAVLPKITRIKLLDPYIISNGFHLKNDERDAIDFLDLWDLSRATLCGDPRDKVYAVTSLANRDLYKTPGTVHDRRPLVPDYNKPVREVYCEAAWFTLLTHGSLDIFAMIGHVLREGEHNLPSWVPDLSQSPNYRSLLVIQRSQKGLQWSAPGSMRWKIPPPSLRYQMYLGVQGSLVGKIQDTSREDHNYNGYKNVLVDYNKILDFSKLLSPTYLGDLNGQPRFEVLWRTMIADWAEGTSPAPSKYEKEFRKSCYEALQKASDDCRLNNFNGDDYYPFYSMWGELQSDLSISTDEMNMDTVEATEFERRRFETMDKRRLFFADTGHVGCGEASLRVGDLVVVVAGYPIPFIMREADDGKYRAIGEAYVHGIMFGEHAMKPDVKWESIILE